MDLKPLPPEFDELRTVIIASNLTSSYLLLSRHESAEAYYERFRIDWLDTFKEVYKLVSKMKPRDSSRE